MKTLIIIPAYNEGRSIRQAADRLAESCPSCDVLIVNDGSVDDTKARARESHARVLSLCHNLGVGGAVQTGFRYALKKGYDAAVQFDGDNQHPAQSIPALLEILSHEKADIVIGSRFLSREGFQAETLRRPAIRFLSGLLTVLTGACVTDATSGFRAFGPRALRLFATHYPTRYPEPEALLIASKNGLRILEVPVAMRERAAGTSNFAGLTGLHYMFTVLMNLLFRKMKSKGE
ncbi:MAG: glycosyltransferase family 2 protein [Fibrobacterota bacterium]